MTSDRLYRKGAITMLRKLIPISFLLYLALIALLCPAMAEVTGKCGDNVYYSIDTAAGVCVISGTGDMKNDSLPSPISSSWYSMRTLIVQEGVTSIDHYAFNGCSRLTDVYLPDTLQSIDSFAFWGCTNLVDINMPDSIASIGAHAFDGCAKLAGIHIPNNLRSIGTGLFYDCVRLTDEFVSQITNPIFFSTSDTFCGCAGLTRVTLPDAAKSIGSNVFGRCVNLSRVEMPDTLETISSHAFTKCAALSDIQLPTYLVSINRNAFSECSALRDVYFGCPLSRLEEISEDSGLWALPDVSFHCAEAASDFLIKDEDGQKVILGCLTEKPSVQIPDDVVRWEMTKRHATLREVFLPSTLHEACAFTLYVPNVYIMDGAESTGTLTLRNLSWIYLPQSLKDLDGLSIYYATSQDKPTVYCYENSSAEIWALKKEYNIRYVTGPEDWDAVSLLDTLSWNHGTINLDIGETFTFDADQFTVTPQGIAGLTPMICEATGLDVHDRTIAALTPGRYEVKIRMGGKTVQVPVYVYKPITAFKLDGPDLAKTGESIVIRVSNMNPSADNSGRFTWLLDGAAIDETGTDIAFTAPDVPGTIHIKAIANSGLEVERAVWIASEISEPYVDDYARSAVVGGLIDILVDVDGVTCRNDPRTFKSVEINSTSRQYIERYADSGIWVRSAGRSVFSVTGHDGEVRDFLVVSHDPVSTLTLPSNCRIVGAEAFRGTMAECAVIPSGCEWIQADAFAESGIKLIHIPETVSRIDESMLRDCDHVTIVCKRDSYAHRFAESLNMNVIAE